MELEPGFPPIFKTAVADARYVHRYNYSTRHQGWIIITGARIQCDTSVWSFRLVEPVFGMPIGEIITTNLDLWADRFANRPFDIESPVEDQRVWFGRLCGPNRSRNRIDEMYETYVDYLQHSSSYSALRAAGVAMEHEPWPVSDLTWPPPEGNIGTKSYFMEMQSQDRFGKRDPTPTPPAEVELYLPTLSRKL